MRPIVHAADQIRQMLQVELDSLLFWFRRGLRLPVGPQSRAGVQQRLPHVRRSDRLLLRKSHLTLDILRLVCFQPLHRALLWSPCRCRALPVEIWPHWTFGSQAWRRSSQRGRRRLPRGPLKSSQRHFCKTSRTCRRALCAHSFLFRFCTELPCVRAAHDQLHSASQLN